MPLDRYSIQRAETTMRFFQSSENNLKDNANIFK